MHFLTLLMVSKRVYANNSVVYVVSIGISVSLNK
jgi:hypothetical protein